MQSKPGYGWSRSRVKATRAAFDEWMRRENLTRGSGAWLHHTAVDLYGPLGLADTHRTPRGTTSTAENPVDAFRHTYTMGMLAQYSSVGEFSVRVGTRLFEGDQFHPDPAHRMDVTNNHLGLALYKELADYLGRSPTEEEFKWEVVFALLDDELTVRRYDGDRGWEDRLRREAQESATAREIERQRQERKHSGRYGRDRMDESRTWKEYHHWRMDRYNARPGFGDGKTMLA